MQRFSVAMSVVLMVVMIGVVATPAVVGHPSRLAGPSAVPSVAPAVGTGTRSVVYGEQSPLTSFARTVLVETFTGVWCIHCPAESMAFHNIDQTTNESVISIAELHSCAFAPPGACLDNYHPPDNTTDKRALWYNICGYPDVYMDGKESMCGATDSVPQMQGVYSRSIANASAIPANASISQDAWVSGSQVIDHANITSSLNGSYNVITYLLEYIGKLNQSSGYGPHDVDNVVRATMHNHPVTFTPGATTEIDSSTPIVSGWVNLNFSVVTFVQDNSTKRVQNANMEPVLTLSTSVSANQTTMISGTTATITVKVHNTTTGASLPGAAINLTSSNGGTIVPASGVTDPSGTFTATYTAPHVNVSQNVQINVHVSDANYTDGAGSVLLVVTPVVLPLAPSALTVLPANGAASINWTAPGSGGAGLTYHIFRANTQTGTYAEAGTSTTTAFTDVHVLTGQSYWYKVSAQNGYGFSPNSTASPATAVTFSTDGLPASIGWWVEVAAMNVSSSTNDSANFYFPNGFYSYSFGPRSYAFVATGGSGTFTTAGVSLALSATFDHRYASLAGTVDPANATVTVNGTKVTVSAGQFNELLVAGPYTVSVSAPGYQMNNTSVILTPGNLTSLAFTLTLNQQPGGGGGSTSSSSGLTDMEAILIVAGVIALAAIIGAALVISGRRRGMGPRGRRKQT